MSDKCRYCHQAEEETRLAVQSLEQLRDDASQGKYGSYNQMAMEVESMRTSLLAEKARADHEHELYLHAHRENMKAAIMMMELKKTIESESSHLKKQSNAHRDAQIAAESALLAMTKERDELLAWKCRAESQVTDHLMGKLFGDKS